MAAVQPTWVRNEDPEGNAAQKTPPTLTPSLLLPLQTTWMGSCEISPRISSQPQRRMIAAELRSCALLEHSAAALPASHPSVPSLCLFEEPCSPRPH